MKDFLKIMLATVAGILATGILFGILGIITVGGMVASLSDSETTVPDGSVLMLRLSGNIPERHVPTAKEILSDNADSATGLDEILTAIQKAKDNKNIKGICLKTDGIACSYSSAQSIRNALMSFKKNGKFIVAYGGHYSQAGYYLASTADKVILNPHGDIEWGGLSVQTFFLKDLLDKAGIQMQVFRVGTYKSAVEPYTSDQMSEANREQTLAFASSIWKQVLEDVSATRHIPTDTLNALADKNLSLCPANELIRYGLADTLLYESDVQSYLKRKNGLKDSDRLPLLSLKDMANVKETVLKNGRNKIAVYYACGEIVEGKSETGDAEYIYSGNMTEDLRRLRDNESVKAVVIRVNSPGGSAYASEQIWHEVEMLKQKKPVVVSMGEYAASGGYYISCGANSIVAEPATLTGSIGIFGMWPNIKGLTGKLGVRIDGVKTNRLSDLGDISREMNEEEASLMQNYIEQGYELFVRRCAEGRDMTTDDIEKIAEGRVWTGQMAKERNLVDELGGLDKAVAIAAKAARLEDYALAEYPEKPDMWTTLLNIKPKQFIHAWMSDALGTHADRLFLPESLKTADRLQARMPFIIQFN